MSGGSRAGAREAVALALASGRTVQEAARLHEVGERTVYKWRQQPEFVRRVDELRAEMVSRALGVLLDGSTHAAATLRLLLSSQSDAVRLRAAASILELGAKLHEATRAPTTDPNAKVLVQVIYVDNHAGATPTP